MHTSLSIDLYSPGQTRLMTFSTFFITCGVLYGESAISSGVSPTSKAKRICSAVIYISMIVNSNTMLRRLHATKLLPCNVRSDLVSSFSEKFTFPLPNSLESLELMASITA